MMAGLFCVRKREWHRAMHESHRKFPRVILHSVKWLKSEAKEINIIIWSESKIRFCLR